MNQSINLETNMSSGVMKSRMQIVSELSRNDGEFSDENWSSESESDIPWDLISTSSADTSTEDEESLEVIEQLTYVETFLEVVAKYDDEEFKKNFRLNRTTCEFLIEKIREGNVLPVHTFGRKKISATKAVYLTVWYLANTETFQQVSSRFNITKSSAHRVISKVIDFLVRKSPMYIVWPNEEKKVLNRTAFQAKQGIDGVIGAVAASHIRIKKPKDFAHLYCNQQGGHSILLQGVCDCDKKFIDVFCGEGGAIDNVQLLQKSSLYARGLDGLLGEDFLLADSAYPCLPWLISPFPHNGTLTRNEIIFNNHVASTQDVIQDTFQLLKGRFQRLRSFENDSLSFIVKCVVAATVLHNICIDFKDDTEAFEEERESWDDKFVQSSDDKFVQSSDIKEINSRRNEIFNIMFPTATSN